jgi:hypothetical protein
LSNVFFHTCDRCMYIVNARCQKLKFSFLLLEYCKIRECYAVANAFTIRNMYSLFLYMNCNSRICDYTVDYMCRTKTSKSPHAFAMCSIRTDLLKQENEKIDSLQIYIHVSNRESIRHSIAFWYDRCNPLYNHKFCMSVW